MRHVHFPEANTILKGGDDRFEDLPVWTDGRNCVSCWRPTVWDVFKFLCGARLFLWQPGRSQPPTSMVVDMKGPFEEVKPLQP